MLLRSFYVYVKGWVTETSTVIGRGLKPLAYRASRIKKPVTQTGPTALKHASGHRASANDEPCCFCNISMHARSTRGMFTQILL